MKASEARKLADINSEKKFLSEFDVRVKISEAAREGRCEIFLESTISDKTKDSLKADGYTISLYAESMTIYARIAW